MHFRLPRLALAFASLASLTVFASPAAAGGALLPSVDQSSPSFVDVRMAVAVTPTGSTRWTELNLPSNTRALWLVPAKPGAAVDWVPSRWLDALDEATRPRIEPPSSTAACMVRTTPETPVSWTSTSALARRFDITVAPSADAAMTYASGHGYRTSAALSAQLVDIYATGWRVLLIEVAAANAQTSTETIRVSDDGGPVMPLALSSGMTITAFTIGDGSALFTGADIVRDIGTNAIQWGSLGSNYTSLREVARGGGEHWLRESYAHAPFFAGLPLGSSATPSVAAGYFGSASCIASAEALHTNPMVVGVACPPGADARVPGGTACTTRSGDLDPSTLSCSGPIDFALSLAGSRPVDAVVTRWAGTIPDGAFGSNLPLSFTDTASHGPVFRAGSYETCGGGSSGSSSGWAPPPSEGSSGGGYGSSGSAAIDVPIAVAESCGSTSEPVESDSSSDSCGSSSPSTTGDGWDDSDGSSDSCSSSDDSSTDSCGSSKKSTGGDDTDGWDTEDNATPKAVKPHAMHKTKRKKSSPASRIALLAVAIVLPFRRRARPSL